MNQYDTYFPDPEKQARKRTIESLVQLFRDIWQDLSQNVDVIFTDQNPFTPPAIHGPPVYMKEWSWTCSDGTVTIKIKAARLMMECDVLIIQRYPLEDGKFWTAHRVEIIDQ